jgi:hypothetical protein
MCEEPQTTPQEESKQTAKRSTGVVGFLCGCALTGLLGIVGAGAGLLFLSPLFAHLTRPPGPRGGCGMWPMIPLSLSVVAGGLAGLAMGLFLVWRLESRYNRRRRDRDSQKQ